MPSAPQEIQVARLASAYGPVVMSAHDQRDKPLADGGRCSPSNAIALWKAGNTSVLPLPMSG